MTTTFTTTISSDTLSWLKNRAKFEKKTIRAIIEESVKAYQIQEKKEQLRETFIRANQDPEMHKMAEEGLIDSNEQFHNYEKS